jgi:hypothetical protein
MSVSYLERVPGLMHGGGHSMVTSVAQWTSCIREQYREPIHSKVARLHSTETGATQRKNIFRALPLQFNKTVLASSCICANYLRVEKEPSKRIIGSSTSLSHVARNSVPISKIRKPLDSWSLEPRA